MRLVFRAGWIALAWTLVFSAGGAGAAPLNNPIITGLVAAYEFSGNADDVSGNGNDGVVNGATPTADRFGNANSAYSFDGSNDYISVEDDPALDLPNIGTISLWFNVDVFISGGTRLITKYRNDTATEDGYNLLIHQGGVTGWIKDDNGGVSHTMPLESYSINATEWAHYGFVINGDNSVAHYLNGIRVDGEGSSQSVDPSSGNGLSMLIGADRFASGALTDFFSGSIDDVYLYDRALSASEVQTLYSAVPEPSTALLLGLGLVGMAAARRRIR